MKIQLLDSNKLRSIEMHKPLLIKNLVIYNNKFVNFKRKENWTLTKLVSCLMNMIKLLINCKKKKENYGLILNKLINKFLDKIKKFNNLKRKI